MMDSRIIIDLHETDTQSFKDTNLIQIDAKEKFRKLIEKFTDKNKQNTNQKSSTSFPRVHNTILIDGKRGMGKTSFMLSVVENGLDGNICSLDIIDPTLIETSEHVFLNIITHIKCKIDEITRCKECEYANKEEYRSWKESLKKLASGLSMLDGVGGNHLADNSLWDSPELVLERGLSNSKHGYTLEKDFHAFIDESLKVLKKDAFLLVLDDIDTSLDKGKEILEVLRKYLTSPKLIIVMLGDIDLYSILVRQLQWEKLDPKKILKDYEGKNKYLGQIEHLEEQYLVKVLKPENRINLRNLFDLKSEPLIVQEHAKLLSKKSTNELSAEEAEKLEKFEKEKVKRLQVTISEDKEKTEELEKYVSNMLNSIFLIKNSNYAKYYEHVFLTQSTRSVLQILQSWQKQCTNNSEFLFSLRHTFYTTLKKKLEPYNLLEIPQKEQFLNLLSIYILKEGISRDNHLKLTPEFSKDEDNIAMLYLNALANFLIQPSDYLSYFIKIGYVLEQYLNFDNKTPIELMQFVDHIALDSGESLSKIAKRLLTTSQIGTNTHRKPILFGGVFISQKDLEKLENIENLFLILSRVNGSKLGGQYNFLSIFNLLGFIADLVSDGEKKFDENIQNIQQILEFALYLDKNINDDFDDNSESNEHDYKITEDLRLKLKEWFIKSKDVAPLPFFVFSKIWVRLAYTYSNISKNKYKNYYEIFEMFIVGFLNALYVEIELYYNQYRDDSIFLKNPAIRPDNYFQKIKSYSKDTNKYTLYDFVKECPIFNFTNNKLLYFNALEEVILKIDFATLSKNTQQDAIKQIDNWKTKTNGTINTELSKQYKNIIQKDLNSLLTQMRGKTETNNKKSENNTVESE